MTKYTYIHAGVTHTDISRGYMEQLGMNTEQIESVLSQYQFETSKVAKLRQEATATNPTRCSWNGSSTRPAAEQHGAPKSPKSRPASPFTPSCPTLACSHPSCW